MPYDRSVENARPPRRFPPQNEPYVTALVQEAPDVAGSPGSFSTIETISLATLDGGLDSDARYPAYRDLTSDAGVLATGWLRVVWVNQDSSTAASNAIRFYETSASPDGAYCTADQLRTELGVDDDTLTDTAASALIADACDVVDSELGAWEVDEFTGRKIVQEDVETWQWDLLSRATVKAAAILYARPTILTGQQYDRVKGPDFEFWGRQGSPFGTVVSMLLDRSELRRLTTTMSRGTGRPPWYAFSYGVRED